VKEKATRSRQMAWAIRDLMKEGMDTYVRHSSVGNREEA
jgi:hypothetical protein